MRHLTLIALLAGGLGMIPVTAASVRTLAFDLPEAEVSFDLSPVAEKTGSEAEGATKFRIGARKNQFSAPVKLPPGRYVAVSSAFPSTAQFTLADTAEARVLLVILPGPNGACVIFPVPDDIAKIGPGDRFLINATSEEIAVRFGAQRSNVKPGHSEYLRPPKPAPADRRIEVEMVRLVGAAWIPFNSTYWPLDPLARSFVLVHPDPVTGAPRVRNLSEVP